jgi:hypothetical protein
MKAVPAIWIGEAQFPPYGARGTAWPAFGTHDPKSAEYGAWCFAPDEALDEEGAYYCDPDRDLSFDVAPA